MSIRAAIKSGSEPIPGYTLRKRLGAGGYGEVWLADAPGGLQKAVKLIYGTVDQSHATSELRSLQRIRQVYHPFLLSIERIEIVDSQVIIVTELAENSLLDRFEQCRRKGAPGIERAQLLDFMRDAADALDYLSQKHALQHLDVKPGNLLIIADRIKVADFGLIKDLHDQNQSLVSGLTPTYSAPEIFDGRPDYRSDQYSLAIVYMEMLTGQVPFNGKSTGELARQHLTQIPNLESLPPADRAVVARSLSKNPLDRYGTCRLFIEQLMKTRGAVLPAQSFKAPDSGSEAGDDLSTSAEERKTSTESAGRDKRVLQPAIETRTLARHWNNPRAMFIGLGGIGGEGLMHLRQLASRDCDNRLDVDDHAWGVIDTDAAALNAITVEALQDGIPPKHAFELRIFRPSEYRNAPTDLFSPLSRRWLYNIPRSLKTEGVRPLAILALLDHYAALRNRLSADLGELVSQHEQDADCQEPLRIYVMASLHGGTGSALLAEIGLMIRRILRELAYTDYRICALVSAATTTHNASANLYSAAGLATLSELSYLMDRDCEVAPLHFGDKVHSVASVKPFDWVTLVDGGLHGVKADADKAARELANLAWFDSQSPVGAILVDSRLETPQSDGPSNGWLRAAASVPISVASNVTAARLARWCCEQTLMQAVQYMAGPKGMATKQTRSGHTSSGQTSSGQTGSGQTGSGPRAMASLGAVDGDFPLTPQASEDFTLRLLKEMAFPVARGGATSGGSSDGTVTESLDDTEPEQREHFSQLWGQRLSRDPDVAARSLASDGEIWKRAIAKIVKLRVYNWKQIEQIQVNTIEAIISFYETEAPLLAAQLSRVGARNCSVKAISAPLTSYLKGLSEQCLERLQEFQREGRALAKKVRSWCDSINAEKALNEATWDVNLSGLPPKLQLLANRVSAVLESTIHRMASQQAGVERMKPTINDGQAEGGGDHESTFNLKYMLSLSNDLVGRLAAEMGISDAELNGSQASSDAAFSFKQIASYFPNITHSGGKLFRLLVTPVEQEQVAQHALKKENLESKTTLVPSRRSLESTLLCDACDLRLHQLVSSLWRPCPATLQLAERLRTRIDVDWYPADRLLDAPLEPVIASATQSTVIPEVGPLTQSGTLAIPAV